MSTHSLLFLLFSRTTAKVAFAASRPWASTKSSVHSQSQRQFSNKFSQLPVVAFTFKQTQSRCSTTQSGLHFHTQALSSYPSGKSSGSILAQATRQSLLFHKYKPIMDAPPGVFSGSVDRFNGITVESQREFEPAVDGFAEKLLKSLEHWNANKRRAIWFKVQTEHAAWIPHLTQNGFEFHHAKNGYVMLYRWLPTEESANIPVYAHSMVGVGGLVVNEKNEVLVVSERYSLIPESWKLPGGYVEPAEDLVDAAIREVQEETGIECDFRTVISIRHTHGGSYACSDLYVVIGLKPRNLNWQRCEREIAEVKWMPVSEYLQHPKVHETNRHFMRTYLDYERRGIRFTCEKGRHQILKKEYCLYFMQPIEEEKSAKEIQAADVTLSTTSCQDKKQE